MLGKSVAVLASSSRGHSAGFAQRGELETEALLCFCAARRNAGEVCTCQSRLLVQEDIYEQFMERVVARYQSSGIEHPRQP